MQQKNWCTKVFLKNKIKIKNSNKHPPIQTFGVPVVIIPFVKFTIYILVYIVNNLSMVIISKWEKTIIWISSDSHLIMYSRTPKYSILEKKI